MALQGSLVFQGQINGRQASNINYVYFGATSLLLKLPAEIRVLIYRLALKSENPIWTDDRAWRKAPGLLKTCKQIYAEAAECYYKENTVIYDIGNTFQFDGTTWNVGAERYHNFSKINKCILKLADAVMTTPPRAYSTACRKQVARFVQALFQVPGLHIEVQVSEYFAVTFDLLEALGPLSLLRNVEYIRFAGAWASSALLPERTFLLNLGPLVIRNSTVESSLRMYRNLKAYALSFERHPKRRLHMDIEPQLLHSWPDWMEHASFYGLRVVSDLKAARRAGIMEDPDMFLPRRERLLRDLEHQYSQIKLEKRILLSPVYYLQRAEGETRAQALCSYYFPGLDQMHSRGAGLFTAAVLLRFAKSFRRIPTMISNTVPMLPGDNRPYQHMDLERTLKKLYLAGLRESNVTLTQRLARKVAHRSVSLFDWTVCRRLFKRALRDMLTQYDDILRARLEIFKDDMLPDIRYGVADWEFEDSADTVYADDDPDRPMDTDIHELLFGAATALPTFAHPLLDKARLIASQEPPSPRIVVECCTFFY